MSDTKHIQTKTEHEEKQPHRSRGSVTWGVVFIALGIAFLLHNFDIITFDEIGQYWPAALIVIGLLMMFRTDSK